MPSVKGFLNDKERIEFTKNVEQLLEARYANWRRILTLSFLKGLATGLGIFLGGTIVVGLLLWMLSSLRSLPFVGELSKAAEHSIDEKK